MEAAKLAKRQLQRQCDHLQERVDDGLEALQDRKKKQAEIKAVVEQLKKGLSVQVSGYGIGADGLACLSLTCVRLHLKGHKLHIPGTAGSEEERGGAGTEPAQISQQQPKTT